MSKTNIVIYPSTDRIQNQYQPENLRPCQRETLVCIDSRTGETNISKCTGSGKSLVICIASIKPCERRILLVFPSLLLIQQFHHDHHKALKEKRVFYFATDGTLKGVKQLSADFEELNSDYIILTTYTSVPQIFAALSEDRKVDRLIADEAHHIKGPVYKAAYAAAAPFIRHTIHLSATLPEGKEPHYKYPLLKGIRDGVVRDFNIELFICKNGEETGLIQMIEKLVTLHSGKAKILIYTAEANTDGSSVRTFMTQYASVARARGWWMEGIHAETTERRSILKVFESDKSPASILVSCRTLSEGIDLKNANCMLPWDPTASIVDNIQRIGRVLRLYKTAAGAIAKDQPPSTILIPVFLEEGEYAACGGDREAIHKLLEKQIGEGEKGNFRPIVSVCTALKSELAQEDSDLFNQLLNYPYTPKVRVDRDLLACVAKQLKRSEEDILEEVADSLVGQLDEEVIDSIRAGEWESEETGAVVTALAESQGIRLIIRDNDTEEVVGTGTKEIIVERKGEGVYTASRKKKSSDAARQRVAHRLRTSFSDGCRVLLGLEGADLSATEGLVLARLTAEVQYDEDWEKRRLEWVAFYKSHGRIPINNKGELDELRAGNWQNTQRQNKKKNRPCMTPERISLLESMDGWEWEKKDTWESMRQCWISHYTRLGHSPSPTSKDIAEQQAGQWQSNQRTYYRNTCKSLSPSLSQKKIRALEKNTYGWAWENRDTWEDNRKLWSSLYDRLGKAPSQSSKDKDEAFAGSWQNAQRNYYKDNTPCLTSERRIALDSTIGWCWIQDKWETSLLHWVNVRSTLGRLPNSRSGDEEERFAGRWQQSQRTNYRKHIEGEKTPMTSERIEILEATKGWKWSAGDPPTTAPITNTLEFTTATVSSERTRHIPTTESLSVISHESISRPLSTLEQLHKAYKTRNADTYFSLMQTDPSKFEEYHVIADTYDARDPPERKPQNRIAEMLKKNNRATYRAVDLGCGRNALRRDERVSKMSWDSVDVVASDSTVTVADMGHLPFEDETYDIAILNRSLWARNHEEVLREVWRILKEGGRAILCESFQRWQEAGENTLLAALKTVGFTIISEYGTTTDSSVSDVFQYIEVRR